MARILVVDDNDTNRKLVVAMLHYEGHDTEEATDGSDGLATARRTRPDLVISDILMPSMDGYEFVRLMRQDDTLQETPVIFYTAYYHEAQARSLAKACSVSRVLVKPCAASDFEQAVSEALTRQPATQTHPVEDGFDREHLQVVTDMLARQTADLRATKARLEALTDLNLQLASERDPRVLLERVCQGARSLLGSRYALLAVSGREAGDQPIFFTGGIEAGEDLSFPASVTEGLLDRVVRERRAERMSGMAGQPLDRILPVGFPPAYSVLAGPIMSITQTFGWLCLADKIGASAFDAEDERILAVLGAQAGRIYENGSLYREIQRHAAQLQVEMDARARASEKIEHLNRVHSMLSGINSLIVRVKDRDELFRESCRLAVEHGRFRVACCAWLDPGSREVVPAAWAGDSPDLAEASRCSLTGADDTDTLVATAMRLQKPIVCNRLESDRQRVLFREELIARGYHGIVALPLVIDGNALGCMILITDERDFFTDAEMRLLTELAGDIAFALDHIAKAERINYLAYYDSLTGLANGSLFQERLTQYVDIATREARTLALVIAEPERLDAVNDTYGRHTADELLRQLAQRLAASAGSANEVARLGTEQFAALIFNVRDETDVILQVEEMWRSWLGHSFKLEVKELLVAAKAGIAIFPGDGGNAETLIKNAQAALKKAKSSRERFLFYTAHLSERAADTLALETELRKALEREEFVLHYQPKVDLDTRTLQGVEALIRWQSPERGLMGPLYFIPLLEETGMIVDVGLWALRQACLDRSRWLEQRLNAPRIAVNVSTVQLQRADFVRSVGNILKLAGSEAGIDIEVTESVIMDDALENIGKLRAIRELGVHISIDDFGTGYSSLAYLTRLPAETLKIDRSFVASMLDDPGTMTLVSTIISLGRSLNLIVVAEGVESEEQAKILRLLRCNQMQGFLISKPLPFNHATAFLARSSLASGRH
jgi:diguanylate cyclase (GGDEF)-like protein